MLGNRLGLSIRDNRAESLYRNILSNAVARWSINDSTIRVREDDGNTEQDFPPVGGKLDVAGITAFVGANSGYVTKIYDKTGNGNDAIQTVEVSQPRLVNAGAFEVDSNGDYAIRFDEAPTIQYLVVTDNQGLNITTGELTLLAKVDREVNDCYFIARNATSGGDVQYGLYDSEAATQLRLNGADRVNDGTVATAEKIIIATYDKTNAKIYKDGILKDTQAYTADLVEPANVQTIIGARANYSAGLTGHISEIVIFNKALTQSQVTLITNRLA